MRAPINNAKRLSKLQAICRNTYGHTPGKDPSCALLMDVGK